MSQTPLIPVLSSGKPKKLLDQTRDTMRLKHYSIRTERSYCDWIERFIRFHNLRHPSEMGAEEVTEFLTDLARNGKVAASTQNQALSALLFLYKEVLKQKIEWLENVERAKSRFDSLLFSPKTKFTKCSRIYTGCRG
jgi:site-specific recombinase XerD